MRTLHDHVEQRLLDDAKQAFVQADYAEAIPLLRRLVRAHPRSSRRSEARWWLARSYQESGNLTAAAEQFRLLAHAPNPYRAKALAHIEHLEDVPDTTETGNPADGMLVSIDALLTADDPAAVLADHHAVDRSVVLLDIPCGLDGGVLRNGQPLPLRAMDVVVRRLRAHKVAVYLGVTLKCLGHAAQPGHGTLEQWRDWEYAPADPQAASPSGILRRSPYYALGFGSYREFLVDWLAQLRDLPLAGLVFRAEVPLGIHEGFSPLALQAFEREFGETFDPVQVLNGYGPPADAGPDADARLPAVFWKWAGWKAREQIRSVRDLVAALRVRLPRLRFGLEVRRRSLVDPVRGLVRFAEDWAEVARGPFDVVLTTITDADPRLRDVSEDDADPIARMVRSLGAPDKVWVIVPRRPAPAPGLSRMLPEGVRRIYDYRAVP